LGKTLSSKSPFSFSKCLNISVLQAKKPALTYLSLIFFFSLKEVTLFPASSSNPYLELGFTPLKVHILP